MVKHNIDCQNQLISNQTLCALMDQNNTRYIIIIHSGQKLSPVSQQLIITCS